VNVKEIREWQKYHQDQVVACLADAARSKFVGSSFENWWLTEAEISSTRVQLAAYSIERKVSQ
jgi:hypothetical protein